VDTRTGRLEGILVHLGGWKKGAGSGIAETSKIFKTLGCLSSYVPKTGLKHVRRALEQSKATHSRATFWGLEQNQDKGLICSTRSKGQLRIKAGPLALPWRS
jgi:hypothetical protein